MIRITESFLAERNAQLLQVGAQSGAYRDGNRPTADLTAGTPALLAKEKVVRQQLQLVRGFSGMSYKRARSDIKVTSATVRSSKATLSFKGKDTYSTDGSDETATSMATERIANFVKTDGQWLLNSLAPASANPRDFPMNEPLTGSLAEEKKRITRAEAEVQNPG